MYLANFLTIIQHHSGRQLNPEQRAVVEHATGALWVLAGPGSGKTEVLVLRCLKLVCVDKVSPKSIILTTFTDKAAKNIQDRLATYKSYLDQAAPKLRSIDVFQVRVGTLHSLCKDIMEEYRYEGYQNYRLLEDMEQLLFIYEHSELAASTPSPDKFLPLWQHFSYLIDNPAGRRKKFDPIWQGWGRWNHRNRLPARSWRRDAAKVLFNRIVEDRVNVDQMRNQGDIWTTLADAYEAYRTSLENNLRCDFAHLQLKFLEFLASQNGTRFLKGDGQEYPGIHYVLVDEYQDTNPIQEKIYLQLAQHPPHNLCVVGDDDQALYRFRGGTVECMVNFDRACYRAWGSDVQVTPQPLTTNYRSHPWIVNWCDNYIRSFDVMTQPGARVANKPNLSSDPEWQLKKQSKGMTIGDYPAVSFMVGQDEQDVANRFAQLVRDLLDNGIVQDLSQCVLLLKSTQAYAAGVYQNALQQQGIQVYNPRSRTFLEEIEVQTALGALVAVLDPDRRVLGQLGSSKSGIQRLIGNWADVYRQIEQTHPELANYVNQAVARIREIPANQFVTQRAAQEVTNLPANIREIFYHLTSFEPFVTWKQEPEQTIRIGKLSNLLESYWSVPFPGNTGSNRGSLRTDVQAGQINSGQLNHMYSSLVGLLVSEGLNDSEDEEVICPLGRFPIMTVHQAKGLEFPFVFVSKLGEQEAKIGAELQLEDALRQFRTNPLLSVFNTQQRAEQDEVRRFYVAYSRAEYALILLTTTKEVRDQGIGFGDLGRQWFTQQVHRFY